MTSRRRFLKNTVLTSTGFMILPLLSFDDPTVQQTATGELETGFLQPPASARPMAFWMWMNGHVTQPGITLDLEAMREMGLAGAFLFNTGVGVPKGPVVYGSRQWYALVGHAMSEAKRLGLELYLHNAPGYSSTGGPTVTPAMSMQQLVWSEVNVDSNGTVDVQLPQPFTKLGYYHDSFVVAFPTLAAERTAMRDALLRVTVNGKEIPKEQLLQRTAETRIQLQPAADGKAVLQLVFAEPFEARAIAITRISEPSTDVYDASFDHPPKLVLERSDDGLNFENVCTIAMPLLRFMDAPGTANFPPVKATYFRLVSNQKTTLTGVDLSGGTRLQGWAGKANFTDVEKSNDLPGIEKESLIDPQTVVDLTGKLQSDGRLAWEAPAGKWTILRLGHTCTGTKNIAAPQEAEGLEIDKFSKEAVDFYFETQLHDLLQQLRAFIPTAFKGLLIDSYEIGKQNWTAQFPTAFADKRGYGMSRWIPALTGRVVESVDNTEKFLWDMRRTCADLMAENYYGRFKQHCADRGLLFLAQPNGDGVFDSLQVGQHPDLSMGEFWTRFVPGTMNLCRQAITIGHGYGKKIIGAEAFTGMPLTSRWTEYPYALKSQGDYLFAMGINRFVLHVMVHQPYTTGFPGLSMGPYGTHFDRNNTWRKNAGAWTRYLARSSYLLQQGLPVADILYFKGEDPASGIPDVSYVDPPVPKNLAGDVIGPDVLLNRIAIKNNRIVLPDGMQYRLLILAPLKKISLPVLRQLSALVKAGMYLIVTKRPADTPGLESSSREEWQRLTAELWGDLDGEKIRERPCGNGKLYWNKPFSEILAEHNILPDFEFTASSGDAAIHYTHRTMGETEIYFVSNHLRRQEQVVGKFRVTNKQPEIWNAQTGEITTSPLYRFDGNHVLVPLVFDPAGSLFVIFRKKTQKPLLNAVSRNGDTLLAATPFALPVPDPHQKVTNNFTILLWARPDIPSPYPKGVLIFPPEGETIYGAGHAACGLAAGQNGVRVFEREKGPNHSARQVITLSQPLEGWTHLAVRYQDGKPSLFINGQVAGSSDASGKIVHPGLDTAPTDEAFSAFFEGNSTRPELVNSALSDEEIRQHFSKGLPAPELPFPILLEQTKNNQLRATVWQNGLYYLQGTSGAKSFQVEACKTVAINSSWQVQLSRHSGAPSTVQLKNLQSLHRHPDFSVKHFSGTAVYRTAFPFAEKLTKQNRVLLHLGRVEVVAEVELNGKGLGTLWKEPFLLDVTEALRQGANQLTVKVTNLWPNRLIGDAHLPPEEDYDRNGFVSHLPAWFVNNKAKPGQRQTFVVWNTFKKDDPLLESGLLGPVRLLVGLEKIV